MLTETIKKTIESIPFASYSTKGGQNGVTEDITWRGETILEAGSPPRSHCVGAVGEVILKSLKAEGLENVIPTKDIQYLVNYGFIDNEDKQFDGYPGALTELEWGYWVDEEDIQYGDIAQYWHESDAGDITKGHALILTGRGKYKHQDVFKDWSATNLSSINGHGHDWHLINKELKSGHYRVWYIARLDIDMIHIKYGE